MYSQYSKSVQCAEQKEKTMEKWWSDKVAEMKLISDRDNMEIFHKNIW